MTTEEMAFDNIRFDLESIVVEINRYGKTFFESRLVVNGELKAVKRVNRKGKKFKFFNS